MHTLTIESIAENIAGNHTAEAAAFMAERAGKLAGASYSRGTFGRMMAPLIKRYYPGLNLNGQSTSAGLAIQRGLEARGYGFIIGRGPISFEKVAK